MMDLYDVFILSHEKNPTRFPSGFTYMLSSIYLNRNLVITLGFVSLHCLHELSKFVASLITPRSYVRKY